jgi:hypothetical protein
MKTGSVVLAAVLMVGSFGGAVWAQQQGDRGGVKIDFGNGPVEEGWTKSATAEEYSAERGYGWVGGPKLEMRDRKRADNLRRDYVFGRIPSATFRMKVPKPGVYRLTIVTGDTDYGDHMMETKLDADGAPKLPEVHPQPGEFQTLTVAFEVKKDTLDVTFESAAKNFVVNALKLEPAEKVEAPKVESTMVEGARAKWDWREIDKWPDPTKPHVEKFKQDVKAVGDVDPTGLERGDYLKLVAGEVDFWKQHQSESGAIIDPYKDKTRGPDFGEWQYSTPCFAVSAAALAEYAGRTDLVEPAAKAMDWATLRLSQRKGATNHEDFYAPALAHALPLLKGKVDAARFAKWEENIRSFDPAKTYRTKGGNWNVVAISGEWLFHQMGLRPETKFIEQSLAGQGTSFNHPWGLYTEGPMPYDHFPRLWAADMIAHGYDGPLAKALAEVLRRGALTSLFMQSPAGELPAGGRSAHHQWNEAEQCVTYEIYGAQAKDAGDEVMARAFKRGAHLALASMKRWVRPSGEMQIVKNWIDPKEQFGYEGYSAHSQYNLLPMAMLVIAHEHAAKTEDVKEGPAPADVGGFVLDVRERFNKVFANAGGTYVEIETAADLHYNATGLIRIHRKGVDPQIGPSDALSAEAVSLYPKGAPRTTAAVGAAWKNAAGEWVRLAEFGAGKIGGAELKVASEDVKDVRFTLGYQGNFSGPKTVVESYQVVPGKVTQVTELSGYTGPMRLIVPVLADNGKEKTKIEVTGKKVSVSLGGSTVSFTSPEAEKVSVEETLYPSKNGWYRLGVAELPEGANKGTWVIEPKAVGR